MCGTDTRVVVRVVTLRRSKYQRQIRIWTRDISHLAAEARTTEEYDEAEVKTRILIAQQDLEKSEYIYVG